MKGPVDCFLFFVWLTREVEGKTFKGIKVSPKPSQLGFHLLTRVRVRVGPEISGVTRIQTQTQSTRVNRIQTQTQSTRVSPIDSGAGGPREFGFGCHAK
jgi:hypothetical protein